MGIMTNSLLFCASDITMTICFFFVKQHDFGDEIEWKKRICLDEIETIHFDNGFLFDVDFYAEMSQ